ncbi:hypothetical protein BJP36_43555 [Moorena producens JHB]|uniref:Uncharacterized protein n=1 Tax=Moorena producens (strain JHB) TaxID=1454205 RepID=A0A9Q9ST98_MOOP1|nr:hypothetical protein [Moorena producens]WAN69240.1 hypothetical protein BJP36_43555 [Moorena producens JHB]
MSTVPCSLFPVPDNCREVYSIFLPRLPTPDSLGALSALRIKFATGRTAPDSLGALSVGELNSPRVAPLPTP